MIEKLLVVGAGHVGLPLALHLRHLGWPMAVVDHPPRIARLRQGEPGFHEPGVRKCLRAARGDQQFSLHDTLPTVDDTCAVFICIGDRDRRGMISDEPIMNLLAEPARLNAGVICIRSTVPVGTARKVAVRLPDAVVLSVPEFLREGSALVDLDGAEEVIVGTEPGTVLDDCVRLLLGMNGRMVVTTCGWETAEATKLSRNVMNAARVAVINEVETLFDDRRIDYSLVASRLVPGSRSADYCVPGLPAGGSCLPQAVSHVLTLGDTANAPLLSSLAASNNARLDNVAARILASAARRILILGLTYRPDTDDIADSWAIRLALCLEQAGANVRCCDPFADVESLGGSLQLTDLASGLAWADHLVFAVPHQQFLEARAFLPAVGLTDLTGVIAPQRQRLEAAA